MTAIGFIGYPGTGKDAIAQRLVELYGFERIAFGDPVKYMLLEIDPTYLKNYGVLDRLKREGREFTREKLQNLGQCMRDLDSDHWIRAVEKLGIPQRAVFSDIRYPNELAYVQRNCGGYIFAIEREGCGPINDHESEVNTGELLSYADAVIHNNSTIEEAAREVMHYVRNRSL